MGVGFPDFIGIGAAKSGTTWLARRLAKHPDVFVPPRKEINSFDYCDFDANCIEEYKKHFRCSDSVKMKGEISTVYLQSKRAPSRIQKLLPDVKLFVSFRNPIEQIYSHYWHLRRQNFHQGKIRHEVEDLEQALHNYPDLLVEPALYCKHLTRWRKYFPPEQISIIFFDDIVQSPEVVLRNLWTFLGVGCENYARKEAGVASMVEREGVSPRAKSLDYIHRALYGFLVRHIYNPMKVAMSPRHAAAVKDGLRVRQIMERVFFRQGYPDMGIEVRQLLSDKLASEIEALGCLTGRDLSHWY